MNLTIAIPSDEKVGTPWHIIKTGLGGEVQGHNIGEDESTFVIPFGSKEVALEVLRHVVEYIEETVP